MMRVLILSVLIMSWVLSSGCRCRDQSPRPDGPPVVIVDPNELDNAAKEREPNDSPAVAQLLTAEEWVAGTFSATDAKQGDWYWFKGEVGKIATITVSGVAGVNVVLEAFSVAKTEGKTAEKRRKDVRLVKVNNTEDGGGETLANLTVTGDVLLRVTEKKGRQSSGGRYRISYRVRNREAGEETEPNWKRELASELALGGEAIGYLGWHTDTDWYEVDLSGKLPNSLLRVEYDGLDGVRAFLAVHDSAGKVLLRRAGRKGEGIAAGNLMPPPGSDSIFVVVRCARDSNVENRYSLRVLSRVPTRPTEVEPNDDPKQATMLPIGKALAGSVSDARDHDHYVVDSGGPLQVVLAPPAGVNLALAQVDKSGKVLWEVDAGKAGQVEKLPVVFLGATTVLRVRAPRSRDVDPLVSYQLVVEQVPGSGWEREPNDTPDKCTAWTDVALPVRGFIHDAKDVDCYRLPATLSGRLSIRSSGKHPPTLTLVDPAEKQLASASAGAILTAEVQPGSQLMLRASGGAGGADDSYQLQIGVTQTGGVPDGVPDGVPE